MPTLHNKTILILSPQAWGTMFVSKHHYAIQLARQGNRVYFLNPPDQDKVYRSTAIEIKSGPEAGLYIVEHKLAFPYKLKFKAMPVFHWLMKFHIKNLVRAIQCPLDIVWSFDLGNLYPFSFFEDRAFKIFHPVDEPLNAAAIRSARDAHIIFSVTNEILTRYEFYRVPSYFINHGVTEEFLATEIRTEINDPVRIGFSGNLLRNDIDRGTLLQVVDDNSNCIFECWGSYTAMQANVGGFEDKATKKFIDSLKCKKNVILHGAVPSTELAKAIKQMDLFLICYDVQRDQSKGTNYHKVMEYLASGKVIVSNNITTYQAQADLVHMVSSRTDNSELPLLLNKVLRNLAQHNSMENQIRRVTFAQENTYQSQLARIEAIISPL